MTTPIIGFGGSFDSSGITTGSAQAKRALAQVDRQAVMARQRMLQLRAQTTGAFTTMAVAAGGMNTMVGTLATSFSSLAVASGPIALTALALTGVVAIVARWRARQREVTEELARSAQEAQKNRESFAAFERSITERPAVEVAPTRTGIEQATQQLRQLEARRDGLVRIRRSLAEFKVNPQLERNIRDLIRDIKDMEGAIAGAREEMEKLANAPLPRLAERAFTGDSPFGLQAAANRVGLGGDRVAVADVRDSAGRVVRQTAAMVRFNQETEKMIAQLRTATKQVPDFANAIVGTLSAAIGALTGGGGGRGFLGSLVGGLGGIASLVPGIGTLAAGAIGVGGGLLSGILGRSREPQHVVVDEFGPRAQNQQQRSMSFTNVILNANSSIEETERAIRRLQRRDGIQRLGAGGLSGATVG